MKIIICDSYKELSQKAADLVIDRMIRKPDLVLGLATGSSPEGLYANLVEAYREGRIDFGQASSYNLDEYVGIAHDHPQSYHRFMEDHLFSQVNLSRERIHFPDEEADFAHYDRAIEEAGGIDFQILGIGPNGHIAFNEPQDRLYLDTHVAQLTPSTIQANSRFFDSEDQVPRTAVTMGMGSIMKAKEILILANGPKKVEAVAPLLRGDRVYTGSPVSLCLLHPNCTLIVDREAAGDLAK